VTLTQPTESGAVYSVEETAAICTAAHSQNLPVHMDGARFANAMVALSGKTAAELTWKAGVDILSFGTTKNGTMCGEAVVMFRNSAHFSEERLLECKYRHKR
jgi:threonine aldolase